jgi:hypothetical protein
MRNKVFTHPRVYSGVIGREIVMNDLLRYLPPAVALWVSDEIEWVSNHSVKVTIFLVLAWLLRSASIMRGRCGIRAQMGPRRLKVKINLRCFVVPAII